MRQSLRHFVALSLAGALGLAVSAQANAETITFGGLTHGQIVPATIGNVSFTVDNFHATAGDNFVDEGRIFDTNETGTLDPDLENPWSGGNLSSGTDLGNILIIQEHDSNGSPDDEGDQGSTGAGSITLGFSTAITSFGLDLVDIENGGTTESKFGFLKFFDGTNSTSEIFFNTFETQGGAAGNAVFGDNFINRINPISAASFGFASFDKVVVKLQGSGGIDNIQFSTVPLPGGLLLLGSGLLSLGWLARRRRSQI